jgi:hypothetical protein
MKRIIGTVVALAAVLAFGTAAALGAHRVQRLGNGSVAHRQPVRPAPPGVLIAVLPGSSVTVDITGGVASLTGSTLNIIGTTRLVLLARSTRTSWRRFPATAAFRW